jgi:hypothetical protein
MSILDALSLPERSVVILNGNSCVNFVDRDTQGRNSVRADQESAFFDTEQAPAGHRILRAIKNYKGVLRDYFFDFFILNGELSLSMDRFKIDGIRV